MNEYMNPSITVLKIWKKHDKGEVKYYAKVMRAFYNGRQDIYDARVTKSTYDYYHRILYKEDRKIIGGLNGSKKRN